MINFSEETLFDAKDSNINQEDSAAQNTLVSKALEFKEVRELVEDLEERYLAVDQLVSETTLEKIFKDVKTIEDYNAIVTVLESFMDNGYSARAAVSECYQFLRSGTNKYNEKCVIPKTGNKQKSKTSESKSKKQDPEPEPEPQEVKIPIIDSETQFRIDLLSKYGITMNEKYYPLNEIDNYSKIFGNYDLCHHTFRHNEMTNTDEVDGNTFTKGNYRSFFSVCDAWKLPRKKDDIEVVLDELFESNTYNPLKEKFDSLTWDGTKRAESIFIDYLGVEDTPLNRKMTFTWLYAAVKRALEPGCKFDSVLIIQGPQGAGKSLIFDRLSFGYKTNNPDISTKDGQQRMHRAWFVIWDELVSLGKKGTEEAKNFISEDKDDFRIPFSIRPKDYLRHFVFCGTTNEENFLKDYTGKVERRFWVMKATRSSENNIVFKNFTEAVVEQVWAEVYAQYNADKEAGFDRHLVLLDDDYRQFTKKQQEFKAQNDDLRFAQINYAVSLEYPRKELFRNNNPTGFHRLLDEKYFVQVAVRGDDLSFDKAAKREVCNWGKVELFPVRAICDMLTERKFSTKDCKGVCKAFADWYHDAWIYKRGNDGRYYLLRKTPWPAEKKDSDSGNSNLDDSGNLVTGQNLGTNPEDLFKI